MADRGARPLAIECSAAELARALDGPADLRRGRLDTATLVWLTGRWAGGGSVIGWDPARVSDRAIPPLADGPSDGDDRSAGSDGGGSHGSEPVGGGWFGWASYDDFAPAAADPGAGRSRTRSWFGFFDRLLRQDATGRWWLEWLGDAETAELIRLAGEIERLAQNVPAAAARPAEAALSELRWTDRDGHLAAVEQAIGAIRAGELFQVNVCARVRGRFDGDPLRLFVRAVAELAPEYAAFVRTPARTIVSLSPELLLRHVGRHVTSAPIKGTRRRTSGLGPREDPLAVELSRSVKDRAENIMITDLVRNDLSRVCEPGSVRTPRLLDVRPAPGVWNLVSEVAGRLEAGRGVSDLLAATLPAGSVTGAPKIRALTLIDELEADARGVYTGAIGYASPAGRAEFNVAIRTFEICDGRFELGVGGGITAGSVPMAEWQECQVKAAPLLAVGGVRPVIEQSCWPSAVDVTAGVFETMLAADGRIVGLHDHLDRLAASCFEVYGIELPGELAERLRAAAPAGGRHRIRLTVRPGPDEPGRDEPDIVIETSPAAVPSGPLTLRTVTGRTGCWRHKWADRRWLTATESASEPDTAVLPLFGRGDLVFETSRANIAIVPEAGVLATPPLTDDVLPGVTRRRLLDAAGDRGWRVECRPVRRAELVRAQLTVGLSSISGVVGVRCLDGVRLGLDDGLLGELAGWLA